MILNDNAEKATDNNVHKIVIENYDLQTSGVINSKSINFKQWLAERIQSSNNIVPYSLSKRKMICNSYSRKLNK